MCQTCVRRLFAGDALSVYHPAERHARHAAAFALPSQRFALYLPVYGVPQRYAAHALCPDALYHDEQPFQGDDGIQAVKRQPVCNFLRIKSGLRPLSLPPKLAKTQTFTYAAHLLHFPTNQKNGLRPLSLPPKFAKTQAFTYAAHLLQFPANQKAGLRPLSLPPKFAKTQTFTYAAHLLQFLRIKKEPLQLFFDCSYSSSSSSSSSYSSSSSSSSSASSSFCFFL